VLKHLVIIVVLLFLFVSLVCIYVQSDVLWTGALLLQCHASMPAGVPVTGAICHRRFCWCCGCLWAMPDDIPLRLVQRVQKFLGPFSPGDFLLERLR